MKTEALRRYSVQIRYSPEDECYVARIPAFDFVAAHGSTPQQALQEVEKALKATVESMNEHGEQPPEPDRIIAELRRFGPILNKSQLAKLAGMNKNTLASKLRRGSGFTEEETRRIRKALRERVPA